MHDVSILNQELQLFQEKSKWSVRLPGIVFSHEKKRHVCCTGVRPWSLASTKVLYCSHQQDLSFKNTQSVLVVVAVFTLTDRASTIPSNIRGCQSRTCVPGLLDRKRSQEHLQREQKNTTKSKIKRQKKGAITKCICQKNIEERPSIGRVWYSASREPSDTLPG